MTLAHAIRFAGLAAWVTIAAGVDGCAAEGETADPDSEVEPLDPRQPSAPARMSGRIVPTAPHELLAPPNLFKVGGWQSTSSNIMLIELAPDGQRLQAGDVVARFNFRGKRALPHVNRRIAEAQAEAKRSTAEQVEAVQTQAHQAAQRRLAAQKAEIDTHKAQALSQREQARVRIDHTIADFEAQAARRLLVAIKQRAQARADHHDRRVALRERDRAIYEAFKGRFVARASIAGVVRHAYLRNRKRTARKSDRLTSGTHYASIARDERLSVRFYLPETQWSQARLGRSVQVFGAGASTGIPATIRRIEPFPQEIGFLEEDWKLPHARERAYVVLADFAKPPSLPPGVAVEVTF